MGKYVLGFGLLGIIFAPIGMALVMGFWTLLFIPVFLLAGEALFRRFRRACEKEIRPSILHGRGIKTGQYGGRTPAKQEDVMKTTYRIAHNGEKVKGDFAR